MDSGIVTFNTERILNPSFPGAEPPTSQQHSSTESLYSIPGVRSPIPSKVQLKSSPDFPELSKDKTGELEDSEYKSRIHELTKDTTPNVTSTFPESTHGPLNASAIPQNTVYDPPCFDA